MAGPRTQPSDLKGPANPFDAADTGVTQVNSNPFDSNDTGIPNSDHIPALDSRSGQLMDFLRDPTRAEDPFLRNTGVDPQGINQQQMPSGQDTLKALPMAGGIAGGIAGSFIGGPWLGGVPGAGVGGMVGSALKQTIEEGLKLTRGQPTKSINDMSSQIFNEGGEQAVAQGIGHGIGVIANIGVKALTEAASRVAKVSPQVIKNYFNAPAAVKELAVEHSGSVPDAANAMRSEFNSTIKEVEGQMETPALQVIQPRMNELTPRESADKIKSLVINNVEQKYGEQINAHNAMDSIAANMSLHEGAPSFFKDNLEAWGTKFKHLPENQAIVNKYAANYGAAGDGLSFKEVSRQLQDDINEAYRTGRDNKGKFLQEIKQKAENYYDNRVMDLAKKVKAGEILPEDTSLFAKLGQQIPQGPAGIVSKSETLQKMVSDADKARAFAESLNGQLKRYEAMRGGTSQQVASGIRDQQSQAMAQSFELMSQRAQQANAIANQLQRRVTLQENAERLAHNYITGRAQIKQDYAVFKEFMSDIMDVTKVGGQGIRDFIDNVKSIPGEKLVAKMFDNKNSALLEKMKVELPKVYDQVVNSKIRDMADKSFVTEVVNGQNIERLDISKFHDEMMKLPIDVRRVIFTSEEFNAVKGVVNNRKYIDFNKLRNELKSALTDLKDPTMLLEAGNPESNAAVNLGKLSRITGKNMIGEAQKLSAMEAFGKGELPLTKAALKRGLDVAKPMADFLNMAPQGLNQQVVGAYPAHILSTLAPWHPPQKAQGHK